MSSSESSKSHSFAFSAMRFGVSDLASTTDAPRCNEYRSDTWAGVRLHALAICWTAGSALRPLAPMEPKDSMRIPCVLQYARSSACWNFAWHSIWLTAGVTLPLCRIPSRLLGSPGPGALQARFL